jgi:hypothetical protein
MKTNKQQQQAKVIREYQAGLLRHPQTNLIVSGAKQLREVMKIRGL